MNARTLITLVAIFLAASAGAARAEADLISAPLEGGAGGITCSCTNITAESLDVTFLLESENGSSICTRTIPSGFTHACTVAVPLARACQVSRDDNESLSAKTFLCTLSSLDAAGNPTTTIPVNFRKVN